MSGPAGARYTRQVRLAEIGEAGQTRICASHVPLRAEGGARAIEATYLRLAGARPVDAGWPRASDAALPDLGLRHAAAREVGEGALAALAALREILGVTG